MNQSTHIENISAIFSELLKQTDGVIRGMPGYYYRSEKIFEIEKTRLFYQEWVCAGHVSSIPKPGDFITVNIIDEPVIILRNKERKINVLSNLCRHRFTSIKSGSGNSSVLVCPYHNWTYDLNGQLRGAPFMDKVSSFNKKDYCLPTFNYEIWKGFIFVNIDGTAPPLSSQLTKLELQIKNYHLESMTSYFNEHVDWAYNWKAICENFMEGYHLSFVHKDSFGPNKPTQLHEKYEGDDAFTGHKSHYAEGAPVRKPHSPDLTDAEKTCSVFFWIYPSFVGGLGPHGIVYMHVIPCTSVTSHVNWGLLSYDHSPKQGSIESWKAGIIQGLDEDKVILDAIMNGYKSKYAEPGCYGPPELEGNIYEFHRYAAKRWGIQSG